MADEQIAEQVKAADAALREALTLLVRDDGVAPVSVVIVLAHLLGEIAVDDVATHHGVHDAEMALGPVLRQVRQAGRTRAEARRAGKVVRPGHAEAAPRRARWGRGRPSASFRAGRGRKAPRTGSAPG